MPYKTNQELPTAIKKLPDKAQTMFRKVFNSSFEKYDESKAFKIAWAAVKKKFKKVEGKWIAKGMGYGLYRFELKVSDNLIRKGNDGEYYLEGVLSDTMVDKEGKQFTEDALKNYAEQINKFGIMGFISHQDFYDFSMKYSHLPEHEFIAKARKERKGILKVVKAIYKQGKLWIKALIDKRYLKRIKKFKTMSIEALVPQRFQKGNSYNGGYVLGLALDNMPVNPRARIAS